MTLYEKLNELGEKKQSLIDEMEKENKGTPAEERERLLKQVTSLIMRLHVGSHCHRYFLKINKINVATLALLPSLITCKRIATMKEAATFTTQAFNRSVLQLCLST